MATRIRIGGLWVGINGAPDVPVPGAGTPPPDAPTGLNATAGDTEVDLTWNASATATSYTVKRSTSDGGPYTNVQTGITDTNFTDENLTNGTTYYYVVSASNVGGESSNSTQVSATPEAAQTVPGAPTNVVASGGDTQASLTWQAPADDGGAAITDYSVTVSPTTGVSGQTTRSVGSASTNFVFTGLSNGTAYSFTVAAVNSVGTGAASNPSNEVTPQVGAPNAPTGLNATAGDTEVSLTWNAAAGAVSYTVKRSTSQGGPYAEVEDEIAGTSYNDTGLTNGTTYYYVVSAVNAGGESPDSSEVSATPAAPTAVEAPDNFRGLPTSAEVALSWDAVAGVDSYTVKRSATIDGVYTNVQAGITDTSFTDTSIINGNSYYYVVTAVDGGSESSPSLPVGVAATANGSNMITMTPTSGTYAQGNSITVNIVVNCAAGSMDVVQCYLRFDPTKLSFTSFDDDNSDFNVPVEPTTGNGFVELVMGTTAPGGLTGQNIFGSATFAVLQGGSDARIAFDLDETFVIRGGVQQSTAANSGVYQLT